MPLLQHAGYVYLMRHVHTSMRLIPGLFSTSMSASTALRRRIYAHRQISVRFYYTICKVACLPQGDAWIIKPSVSNSGGNITITRDHSMVIRDYLCYRNGKPEQYG
jgi:hypothetical protein